MKKKLMLILSLFLLVAPLSACGEDEEGNSTLTKYDVNIDLVKQGTASTADMNFSLSDCAVSSGAGRYSSGDNVVISVKYVRNACQFMHFEFIDSNQQIPAIAQPLDSIFNEVRYTIPSINSSTNVKAVFGSGLSTAIPTRLFFSGISKTYVDGSVTKTEFIPDDGNFLFPYSGKQGNEKPKLGLQTLASPSKLSGLLGHDEMDLNYIYLDGVFQPHKLTWRKGIYDGATGACDYSSSSVIDNPNEFVMEVGQGTCVTANVDVTSGKANDELKQEAINTMITNNMYITTDAGHACLTASTGNVSVDTNCMYVGNMKYLYRENSTDGVSYYAINSDNVLEAIISPSVDKKVYVICSTKNLTGQCEIPNAQKFDYSYNNVSLLKINQFIQVLSPSTNGTGQPIENIDSANIKFDYDYSLGVVPVEIKNGTTTYYLNYVSQGYKGTVRMPTVNSIQSSSLYSFAISGADTNETLEKLQAKLNSSNLYKLQSATGDALKTKVKTLLYGIINTDDQYNEIKNNMYTVSVSGSVITIDVASALLSGITKTDFVTASSGGISDTCYTKNNDECLSLQAKKILKIIEENILSDSTNKLNNIEVVDIYEEGTVRIFKFKEGSSVVQISYDSSAKKFKLESTELVFVTPMDKGVSTLTVSVYVKSDMFIQEVLQTTSDGINVTTKIGESEIPEEWVDTEAIKKVYNLVNGMESGSKFSKIVTIDDTYFLLDNLYGTNVIYSLTPIIGKENQYELKYKVKSVEETYTLEIIFAE